MNTDYLKGWDVAEQQRRVDFLDELYVVSGRTNGLYTGLYSEWLEEVREANES